MTGRHAGPSSVVELTPPTTGRYRRRELASQWGALVAFAVLVAVVTGAAVATPRLTAALLGADLRHTVASASPSYRDPIASVVTTVDHYDAEDPYSAYAPTWEHMPTTLHDVRKSARPALRNVLDGGHFAGIATGYSVPGQPPATSFGASGPVGGVAMRTVYRIEASPELRMRATLADGRWPRAARSVDTSTPIEVVATRSTASTMHWRLGRVNRMSPSESGSFRVRLVGIVTPADPTNGFWTIDQNRAAVSTTHTSDGTPILHGTVFAAASGWPTIAGPLGGDATSVWFDVRADRFDTATLPAVQSDLAAFLANPQLVNAFRNDGRILQFQTFLPQTLQLYTTRANASSAILALSATGPLGVAAVTILLGTRGLLDRRRAVRALLRSRGASAWSLAFGAARDVGVASIPGAVVGTAAAVFGIPVAVGPGWIVAAAVCALGAPVVAAVLAGTGSLVATRRRTSLARFRWAAEALVVAAAAGAVAVVIRQAATATTSAGPGSLDGVGHVDVLVTATPLLLAAAVVVLLLRVRPTLARGMVGLVRRRGAAAFVGTAEDVRGGSAAGWVLATIVGATSIGVLAAAVVRSAEAVDLPTSGSTRGLDTDPLVSGIGTVVVAGLLLSAVMTAAAITLTVVSAAPARQRRGAMLRTIGLSAGQRTAVTLWELGPRILLGVVSGVVLGLLAMLALVPAIVPAAGSRTATIDPGTVALTAVLFAGAAALATAAAVVTDRRRSGVLDERSDT